MHHRYGFLALLAVVGCALSVHLFQVARGWERQRTADNFMELARDRAAMISHGIALALQEIEALGAFYTASPKVERHDFHVFVAPFLKHRYGVQALEWIPRVPRSQRAAYEKAARLDGFPEFRITERKTQGQMVPVAEREEYFPVYFVEPYRGNEIALGFDLASNTTRLEGLRTSRDTGQMQATARITLVQETKNQFGFLVYLPIYRQDPPPASPEERRKSLRGFALGVFRIGDILDRAMALLEPRGIDVHLFDISAPMGRQFLALHEASPGETTAATARDRHHLQQTPLHHAESIEVAGRTWMVLCKPTPQFIAAGTSRMPWGMLGTGLGLTGILIAYLSLVLARAAQSRQFAQDIWQSKIKLEREIAERKRTQELLRGSELKLRTMFDNAIDGILLVAVADRRFTFANPAMSQMTGYSVNEISEMTVDDLHSPESLAYVLDQFDKAAKGQSRLAKDLPIRRKDGSVFYADATGQVIMLEGAPFLLGVIRDVTERKQAEQQLREEKARSQNYLDVIGVILLALNERGEVRLLNKKGHHVLGYEESALLGKNWFDTCLPERVRDDAKAVFATLIAGEIEPVEYFENEILTKSGEMRLVSWHNTVLTDESGRTFGTLSSGEDITERKRHEEKLRMAEEKLAFQAFHDSLTGLFNRAMIMETLEIVLARARRFNQSLAILFIDLDDFKLVNDTLGHETGDELLRQVAERLRDSLRKSDMVARQGGDEFIVLISGEGTEATRLDAEAPGCRFSAQVTTVVQRIIGLMTRPYSIQGQETYIGASIGISLFPDDAGDSHELLQHADSAMYRAKELGKNNVQFYSRELSQRQKQRLSLTSRLHRALEQKEFVLLYQPIIDLSCGRMIGVEALIRWQTSDEGLVSPAKFLPVAEDTGLIIPIGNWVLEQACRQLGTWQEQGLALRIAVNLSVRQFWHGDIAAKVLNIVTAAGVGKDALDLEITEGAMILDPGRTEVILRNFRDQGLSISLDDFGTGYSSLNRLKQLPINKLKIDKSFVDGIPDDEDDAAIVTAITQLARNLGIHAVAEGIETVGQWRFLHELGCRFGQGYYFSRPVPATEIEAMLRSNRRWTLDP